MGLKIAQINARRSSTVAANLEILMIEYKINALCVQEPYSYKSKIRGYTRVAQKHWSYIGSMSITQ